MKNSRVITCVVLALALRLVGPAMARSYGYCTVCHGAQANGNPAIHAPKLTGLAGWYIRRQLEDFKAGLRGTKAGDSPDAEMRSVARVLSKQQIRAATAYIKTLRPRTLATTVTGNVALGRRLYRQCAACHGPQGKGSRSTGAPALAGQADWYVLASLVEYRKDLRGYSPADVAGQRMRAAARSLRGMKQIRAVVAYIASLPSVH